MMKKKTPGRTFCTAIILAVSAVCVPVAVLAQTDGTIDPTRSTASPTAQDGTTGTPALSQPVASDPAPAPTDTVQAPQSEPVSDPATTSTSGTVPPRDAPAPTLTQTSPLPAPEPTAATNAPAEPPAEASPVPVPLEDIKDLLDTAAEKAPTPLQPWLFGIAGALGAAIAVLGLQQLLKKLVNKDQKKCGHCGGSGHEPVTCVRCEGKGKIDEEYEPTAECAHCEGSGEEPCEECDGRGDKDGVSCAACGGSGTKHDEEEEGFDCSVCGGEGEASITMTREVACPECKGAGKH
jgi:hypothetical protein